MAAAAERIEQAGLRSWTLGTLPKTFEMTRDGHVVRGYPALIDEGDSVAVRLMDTEAEQQAAMRVGTRRLIMLTVPSPVKWVVGHLDNAAKLTLGHNPYGSVNAMLEDSVAAAVDMLVADEGGPAWAEAGFLRLREHVRAELADTTLDVVRRVAAVLSAAQRVEAKLQRLTSTALRAAVDDVRAQLSGLVYTGFISEIGWRRLPDVHRYVCAIELRLAKVPHATQTDAQRMAVVHAAQDEYEAALRKLPPGQPVSAQLAEIRWMLEELRVSLFAQTLKTAYPVSDKRIRRALAAAVR